MTKKNKYLITNFHKLNYPRGSKLVFIDEDLYNHYNVEEKSSYKCSYINSIDNHIKSLFNNSIIKKKLTIYRKEFTILLNAYNKLNNSQEYWGLIIDNFLITLLENIILQIKLFQKIKVKDFHIISQSVKESFFINYSNFQKYTYSNDFRKLLNSIILKELDPKSVNLKYINNEKIKVQNGKKIYKFILISILRLYIYFFKPILIINGYIGLKNTINFFFRSYGKIINIPGNFLFNEVNNNSFIDRNFRQRIRVHEIDIIDKIFNKIVGKFFPASYLENFNSINNDIKIISKKIKTIGTGSCHYSAIDHFNILTAEILKNKSGKLIIFQHGGTISKTNSLFREHIDQKYSSRCYYFDDPKGLGMHRFNEKKISFEEIKKRNSILILNSTTYFSKDFHY